MQEEVKITLLPAREVISVAAGTPLQDVLFRHGVEFPCGGRGSCQRCRVRLRAGELAATPDKRLSSADIEDGWRLACQHRADTDLTLEVAQWRAPILVDNSPFAFTPRAGLGVAVDLGTTTIAAQLLDLQSGRVLAVRTGLNAQSAFGSDVMSRLCYGLSESGAANLRLAVQSQLHELILGLLSDAKDSTPLSRIVIVGNTPMHNIFCGAPLTALAYYPFETEFDGLYERRAAELGWQLPGDPEVLFLPALGSFVGSDLLAGVLATEMHRSDQLHVLVDLGTNGEIVIGDRRRLLCTSTAAGPAFEGAKIAQGMQATDGAIAEVRCEDGVLHCRVLGGGPARGICGSGLVDAVAAVLDLGLLLNTGRLNNGQDLVRLSGEVALTQADIRQLQLAKGAIAAGVDLLLERLGATADDVACVYVAGAFGNYISFTSAGRIGLLRFPRERLRAVGNTALLGAKMALFAEAWDYADIRGITEHVSLNTDPEFQDRFVDDLLFPDAAIAPPAEPVSTT